MSETQKYYVNPDDMTYHLVLPLLWWVQKRLIRGFWR
jgi:hypothetical protein